MLRKLPSFFKRKVAVQSSKRISNGKQFNRLVLHDDALSDIFNWVCGSRRDYHSVTKLTSLQVQQSRKSWGRTPGGAQHSSDLAVNAAVFRFVYNPHTNLLEGRHLRKEITGAVRLNLDYII